MPYRPVGKPKRCPIVRYTVADTIGLIRAKKAKLLVLHDGHAEVLGGKTGHEALGWLSRSQVEKIRSEMPIPKSAIA
jgi:hypothetical protein